MEQYRGQNRHLHLVKPVETPLDRRIWEHIVQRLRNRTLNVNRLELVNEFNHRLGLGL